MAEQRGSLYARTSPQPSRPWIAGGAALGPGLFAGADSLRVKGEGRALWGCALAAPITIAIISLFVESITFSSFVLLVVVGMVFVSVGRGRLLGSSVRIDARQMPEIDELVSSLSQRLRITPPQIFVRDDPFQAITALGIGEPYALVLSSHYIEHLRREELAFLIARELGHIAAGHTRLSSLLSASGRENPVVALVFGAWLRRTEYTADRVGLLCCKGLDAALGAISIATFSAVGRRVDMHVLAEQRRELQAEPTLRMGEWVAAVPYATNRLDALRTFDASPLAARWRTILGSPGDLAPTPTETDGHGNVRLSAANVRRRDCAGFWGRTVAMCIDLFVIMAILNARALHGLHVQVTDAASHGVPPTVRMILQHLPLVEVGTAAVYVLALYFLYSAALVGLAGQTLGMMIFELRVVTTRFGRPSLLQSAWRYLVAFFSLLTSVAVFCSFLRVQPHDRLSGTRLVRGRQAA